MKHLALIDMISRAKEYSTVMKEKVCREEGVKGECSKDFTYRSKSLFY
jgi:hypothetical protein